MALPQFSKKAALCLQPILHSSLQSTADKPFAEHPGTRISIYDRKFKLTAYYPCTVHIQTNNTAELLENVHAGQSKHLLC